MYKCLVFDMDGTLVDSYEGIYQAYRCALNDLGREFGGETFVRRAIGAPLPLVFERMCGLSQEEIPKAVEVYRQYYQQKGKREIAAYAGMGEALQTLKAAGFFLGVATLKKETFAEDILRETGISSYFDTVHGMDRDDRLSKADLIRLCMRDMHADEKETILVGDSAYDADGARKAGVAFLAVTYGFGFRDGKEARALGAKWVADAPKQIPDLIALKEMAAEI